MVTGMFVRKGKGISAFNSRRYETAAVVATAANLNFETHPTYFSFEPVGIDDVKQLTGNMLGAQCRPKPTFSYVIQYISSLSCIFTMFYSFKGKS